MKIARKEPTVLTDIDSYMRGFCSPLGWITCQHHVELA
jgi:hypothetical protein